MTVCLLLIDDGRADYKDRCIASAKQMLPRFRYVVEVNDTDHRLGFAGAIAKGWEDALATGAEHVFHLESDFTFDRPAPLRAMETVLDAHPHLVQLALVRQPWNGRERRSGGIVDMRPEEYEPKVWGEARWLEHRVCFTTNPCLIPAWVLRAGWPQEPESEGRFGISLFASDPNLRAAYWGNGERWVTHIGEAREGWGY